MFSQNIDILSLFKHNFELTNNYNIHEYLVKVIIDGWLYSYNSDFDQPETIEYFKTFLK